MTGVTYVDFTWILMFSVQAKTKQLEILEKSFENLKWEYENMQKRFDILVEERDELKSRFSKAVQEVYQKGEMKTDSLEMKVKSLESKLGEPNELAVSCVSLVS